jgi:uncharacterized protein YjbI with pentapeptide repeats
VCISQPGISWAGISGVHHPAGYLLGRHLRRASPTGGYFTGVHLTGVYLTGVHLRRASHRRASQAYISQAYILQAYISGVHLPQAGISQAGISGVYLLQEGISQACVSYRHASLIGMYLIGVRLADVYLVSEFCDFDFQKILMWH